MRSNELKLASVENTVKHLKEQIKFYAKQEKEYQMKGIKELEFTSNMVKGAYEFAVDMLERDLRDE